MKAQNNLPGRENASLMTAYVPRRYCALMTRAVQNPKRSNGYKRVKGRSHTVEKRISMHPHNPHATDLMQFRRTATELSRVSSGHPVRRRQHALCHVHQASRTMAIMASSDNFLCPVRCFRRRACYYRTLSRPEARRALRRARVHRSEFKALHAYAT